MTLYHPDDRYNRLERAAVLALSGHLRDDFFPRRFFSLDAYGTDAYDPDGNAPRPGAFWRGAWIRFVLHGSWRKYRRAIWGPRHSPHLYQYMPRSTGMVRGNRNTTNMNAPAIGISATGQPGEDRKTLKAVTHPNQHSHRYGGVWGRYGARR